eukprot:m.51289 g.51289  ORF g.51289 m.51289 type:complete len:67 (+) comp16416_c0_seq1:141-341(+)
MGIAHMQVTTRRDVTGRTIMLAGGQPDFPPAGNPAVASALRCTSSLNTWEDGQPMLNPGLSLGWSR